MAHDFTEGKLKGHHHYPVLTKDIEIALRTPTKVYMWRDQVK